MAACFGLSRHLDPIPASNFSGASEVENILDWNFALLMQIQFGLGTRLWRLHRLRIELQV